MLKKIHAKLSQRSERLFSWFAVVLEKLASSRAAQVLLKTVSRRHRYAGRHRQDLKHEAQYTPITDTGSILVTMPRRRRSPAAVLRSHMPRAKAKEAAILKRGRGRVYVGRVSAAQVGLISAITLLRQVDEICERAMHPQLT